LTRDRRGFENTYLMHADRPGDRPRILYWYRTAPGIVLGRAPLDEDAIRAIEDQHPDIEFDWPAILALSEVMTPEDEAPAPRPAAAPRKNKKDRGPRREDRADTSQRAVAELINNAPAEPREPEEPQEPQEQEQPQEPQELQEPQEPQEPRNRLLEELAGREIGARLRARHADIIARIEQLDLDGSEKDALFKRAEALDPELWMTPESVLDSVRKSDALIEELKSAIVQLSRE
jgi:hypothetical protein